VADRRPLFRAYFLEGKDLNDTDDLLAVAAEAGLDPERTRRLLEGDEGKTEVWESQREAARLGIGGVPFYVFDGRYAISGAQPVEMFLRALDAAQTGRVA
jgi:predicted DsbA family dithiol-disulfide isomerase